MRKLVTTALLVASGLAVQAGNRTCIVNLTQETLEFDTGGAGRTEKVYVRYVNYEDGSPRASLEPLVEGSKFMLRPMTTAILETAVHAGPFTFKIEVSVSGGLTAATVPFGSLLYHGNNKGALALGATPSTNRNIMFMEHPGPFPVLTVMPATDAGAGAAAPRP